VHAGERCKKYNVLRGVTGGKFQGCSRTQGVAKHIEGPLDSGAHGGMALLEGLQSGFKGRNDGVT
jgi:hypothetical protein